MKRTLINGAIAGVIGGIIFAFFLVMGNMLPTLGAVINWPSNTGGLIVHAITSIIFGMAFGVIFGPFLKSSLLAAVIGIIFGMAAWVGGPLLMLPFLAHGDPLFSKFNPADIQANLKPLVGHIVFGLVLGITYYRLNKKRT